MERLILSCPTCTDRELLISTRGLVDEQAAQIKALKTTVDMLVKDSQNMADSLAASTELASKRFAVLELRQTDDTKNTSVKLETLVAQHRQAKEEAELGRARLRQKIDETSAKASVLQHLVESNAVALEHERHTREQAHLALAAAGADLLTDKPPGTAGAGGGAGSALHDAPTKTRVRLAVLGRAGVGKSSLIRRFTRNEFGEEHVPTLKATHARSIAVDGHRVDVEILDTAGIASPDLTKMWMEHRCVPTAVCCLLPPASWRLTFQRRSDLRVRHRGPQDVPGPALVRHRHARSQAAARNRGPHRRQPRDQKEGPKL